MYNIKVDDMDMSSGCIENYLEFKDKEPGVVANKYIEEMTRKYGDYQKITIYKRRS